jgi:hypothetical protein
MSGSAIILPAHAITRHRGTTRPHLVIIKARDRATAAHVRVMVQAGTVDHGLVTAAGMDGMVRAPVPAINPVARPAAEDRGPAGTVIRAAEAITQVEAPADPAAVIEAGRAALAVIADV